MLAFSAETVQEVKSRVAWSDQVRPLGREGALKDGQNSLGERAAGAYAWRPEGQDGLGAGEQ